MGRLRNSRKTTDQVGQRNVSDLEIARRDVKEKGFTLSIVRGGERILQSNSPGISVLVSAIDEDRFRFKRASVADKILGRAAAMLFVYSEISCIYASVASQDALAILKRFDISFECKRIVKRIMNRNKSSICPFEKLVLEVDTPEEAFERLKACKVRT